MRVVLDINVLVSARIAPGGEADKILLQADAQYDLLLSDFLLWKLNSVLRYDRIQAAFPHLTEAVISAYIDTLLEVSVPVDEQIRIELSAQVSSDPEDLHVLAAAVDGQADYLVTYNTSHFPATYQQVRILRPDDFRRLLRQD